jgi:uncharacterized membrane protein YccF (DUF307 family)
MSLILNVLWFVLGGFVSGTLWLLAGAIMALTVVGLPWTPSAWRMASFSYWPFGRVVVDRADHLSSTVLNIVWVVFAGWWLALHHILIAAAQAVTIIGIPFAWQHVKLAGLAIAPVGRRVVDA